MAADGRCGEDEGSGLIPLVWGVLAFLMFLFLAVQVAINLYATSTVTALGHDAARRAALAGASPAAIADAEVWLQGQLGDSVTLVATEWVVADGAVALSIVIDPPDLMINRTGPLVADRIERTFVIRIEDVVAAP